MLSSWMSFYAPLLCLDYVATKTFSCMYQCVSQQWYVNRQHNYWIFRALYSIINCVKMSSWHSFWKPKKCTVYYVHKNDQMETPCGVIHTQTCLCPCHLFWICCESSDNKPAPQVPVSTTGFQRTGSWRKTFSGHQFHNKITTRVTATKPWQQGFQLP